MSRTVEEYLSELEQTNPVCDAKTVSTTDPDAVWAKKTGPATLAYFDNYLIDTASRVILGVGATPALFHQETVAARTMVERVEKLGIKPARLGADKCGCADLDERYPGHVEEPPQFILKRGQCGVREAAVIVSLIATSKAYRTLGDRLLA